MIKSVVKWRDKPLQSFKDLCRQNFIRFHMVWHEFSEKLFFFGNPVVGYSWANWNEMLMSLYGSEW